MEKISVIIPTYNNGKYIKRCVDSVLNQDYDDIEIIIVNDGSTDETEKIIKDNYLKDTRVKYFFNENKGVSFSRNFGIDNSDGEFILFLDSDDWLDRNYIKKMYDFLKKNNLDIVRTGYKIVDNSGKIIKIFEAFNDSVVLLKESDIQEKILLSIHFNSVCTQLVKRKTIRDNRFSTELICGEDLLFSLNLLSNNPRIGYENSNYYCYYYNDNSITKKKNPNLSLRKCYDIIKVINNFYLYNYDKSLVAGKMIYEIEHYLRRYILESNLKYLDYKRTVKSILKNKLLDETHSFFKIKKCKKKFKTKRVILMALLYYNYLLYILIINIYKKIKK